MADEHICAKLRTSHLMMDPAWVAMTDEDLRMELFDRAIKTLDHRLIRFLRDFGGMPRELTDEEGRDICVRSADECNANMMNWVIKTTKIQWEPFVKKYTENLPVKKSRHHLF